MKRILIFAGYFYPHIGGYEKIILEVATRLAKIGYNIDIVTTKTDNSPQEETINCMRIFRLPCWNALGGTYPIPKPSFNSFMIMRQVWGTKYDIIHTQTRFFLTSLTGLVMAKLRGIPLLHTEHGSGHSTVSNKAIDILSRLFDHTLGTLLVRAAFVCIGVSDACSDFLKHLGARRVCVIPNGIDTEVFVKQVSNARKQLGIGDDSVVLTFVGRLIKAKGVQDLLSVFPELNESFPGIKLVIIGGGNYRPELEAQSRQLGCQNAILFVGQKSQNEVINILSVTDIFVNPSYSEGLPTSVMEAASIGLPIVATNVGGTSEIIRDGETGFLVEAGNTRQLKERLSELIDNSAVRQKLGTTARAFVMQRYDWHTVIQNMIEVLERKSENS